MDKKLPYDLATAMGLLIREARVLEASKAFANWYLDLAREGHGYRDVEIRIIEDDPQWLDRTRRFRLGAECAMHQYKSAPLEHLCRVISIYDGDWQGYAVAGFVAALIDQNLLDNWGPYDLVDFEWLLTNPNRMPGGWDGGDGLSLDPYFTNRNAWFLQAPVGSIISSNSVAPARAIVSTRYSSGGLFSQLWGTLDV
jgi:hypothetical protein